MDLTYKSVTLVLVNRENEDDVHVYLGNIISKSDGAHFVNTDRGWDFSLSEDTLNEMQEVPPSLKETLLGADLYFTLWVRDIPENESMTQYTDTGLNWH